MKNWDAESSTTMMTTATSSPAASNPIFPHSFWISSPKADVPTVAVVDEFEAADSSTDGWDVDSSTVGTIGSNEMAIDAGGKVKLEPAVTLTTVGQCKYSSSTFAFPVKFCMRVEPGCQWLRLDWSEPVLITRVVFHWGNVTVGKYELQLPDTVPDRWETVMILPNSTTQVEKLGKVETHDIDVPLCTLQPINTLRILVRDVSHQTSLLAACTVTICAYGYKSHAASAPIVLATPMLITSNPADITISASNASSSNLATKNIVSNGVSFRKPPWLFRFGSLSGSHWVVFDFVHSAALITQIALEWALDGPSSYELQIPWHCDSWRTIGTFSDEGNVGVEALEAQPYDDGQHASHTIHTMKVPITCQPTSSLRLLIHRPADAPKNVSLWRAALYGYSQTAGLELHNSCAL